MNPVSRKEELQIQQAFERENIQIESIERVNKGLTNNNFKVKTLSGSFHVRLNEPNILVPHSKLVR